jgi:hypothetical protein
LQIDSPFDYETQALLYLPEGMPAEPTSPAYVPAVIEASVCRRSRPRRAGRFCSSPAIGALAQGATTIAGAGGTARPEVPLLVQGEAPRERSPREFREHGDAVSSLGHRPVSGRASTSRVTRCRARGDREAAVRLADDPPGGKRGSNFYGAARRSTRFGDDP